MVNENLLEGGELTNVESGELSDVGRIALAWSREQVREVLLPMFMLDERLGRIVAAAREPLLAQMRMAWWRDRLGEVRERRPKGDPVLDAIGRHWQGEEQALLALVDGWEELLGDAPLREDAFQRFADGKGGAFAGAARLSGQADFSEAAHEAGCRYALGDCFARLSNSVERERLQSVAASNRYSLHLLPRALRPLIILAGLGDRVLQRGQGPLFGDRGSALLATRLGILGR